MSKLRTKIEDSYITSLKEKNDIKIKTYRLIKSAIKDKDIALRTVDDKTGLSDNDILKLLQSLIKQRKESFEMYKKGGRDNLAQGELEEIDIIKTLLPKQMNQEEIKVLIGNIIKNENIKSVKDMGKIMSILKSKYSGQVDMSVAGKLAKEIIQTNN